MLYQSIRTLNQFDVKHESSIIVECSEFFKYYLKQLSQHSCDNDKICIFEDQLSDEDRLRKRFFVTRAFTFRA
jgi:hypothetical protein